MSTSGRKERIVILLTRARAAKIRHLKMRYTHKLYRRYKHWSNLCIKYRVMLKKFDPAHPLLTSLAGRMTTALHK